MKLEYAIPWTNESYMACNGFHPLYTPMFEDMDSNDRKYNILDEVSFSKSITSSPRKVRVIGEEVDEYFEGVLKKHEKGSLLWDLFNDIGAEDLWLTHNIPGDIEIHHTSPRTTCDRPFVFHCESFLPIFMPFAYQGQGKLKNIDSIKENYKLIFEDKNCLGIGSHLPQTLSEISNFFQSKKIDKKLFETPISLSTNASEFLLSANKPSRENPVFLFTSSAHQSPIAFKGRGGISVLIFAKRFIEETCSGLFIFRCARPNKDDLEHAGLDLDWIESAEKQGHLRWIEGFLSENEQLNLFKSAHFFLLPSFNLHSVSIMQAQAAGAIPVVTDARGVDRLVADFKTGIVLNGVADKVWNQDKQHGYHYDDHSQWSNELAYELADQMFNRICSLLEDKPKYQTFSKSIQTYAACEYNSNSFRECFYSEVEKRYNTQGYIRFQDEQYAFPLLTSQEQLNRIYSSPPVPKKYMDIESHSYFFFKGAYWAIDKSEIPQKWSVLHLARQGKLDDRKLSIENNFSAFDDKLLLPLWEEGEYNPATESVALVKEASTNHPVLEGLLKSIFPYVRSYLVELERELSRQAIDGPSQRHKAKQLLRKSPPLFSAAKYVRRKYRNLLTKFPKLIWPARSLKSILKTFFAVSRVALGITKIFYKQTLKYNLNTATDARHGLKSGRLAKVLNRHPKAKILLLHQKNRLRRLYDRNDIAHVVFKIIWWITLALILIPRYVAMGIRLSLNLSIIILKTLDLLVARLFLER